ncbi:LAMI_0H12442g1_1 [Lachancea mirantina]|uniref:Ubiquitin carboxyl-terminal hydrolase n=1 Tax=Lachancea mirantina TaxID=1230905 RepID=A0A1G4KHK4_9SACH|nr:LAMI_0H12442g1_1 [Lachancea mirantina]
MPHSELKHEYCRSVRQLTKIVDKFVSQDGDGQDMETLLQECIDTLVNYQEETKKLKKTLLTHSEWSPSVFEGYEAVFVYYKIVSQIVLSKIPELEQFKIAKAAAGNDAINGRDKGLMEVYNMLVKTLLTDDKIGDVRRYIKEHSKRDLDGSGSSSSASSAATLQYDIHSGQAIASSVLKELMNNSRVLLIDLRPRTQFVASHIASNTLMCLEPISFKDSYSDADLLKKSLITSPDFEIDLFKKRDTYDFVVIYTSSAERTGFNEQQQSALVHILLNRSFEAPLKSTRVLTLQGGIESWRKSQGVCEETKTDSENAYLNSDLSGFDFQEVAKSTTPSYQYRLDSSLNPMLSKPHAPQDGQVRTPQFFPNQQPALKRNSSFREKLIKYSPLPSRTTTPIAKSNETQSTLYPETPKLAPSAPALNNLPHISPIQSYTLSPISRSVSPPNTLTLGKTSTFPPQGSLPERFTGSRPQFRPNDVPKSTSNGVTRKEYLDKDLDFNVGLVNLGNSCYMNCIVQCLLGSRELCRIFLDDSYKNHVNLNSKLGSKGVLATYFSKLIHVMYNQALMIKTKRLPTNERTAVQPSHFKVACGSINSLFKSSSQQDCQEFCQFLLDGLHEDLNQCGANPPLKELSREAEDMREKLPVRIASSIEWERYLTTDFSVIVDLFQGQYSSQLKCQVCNKTSTTYQPFSVLSVPVPFGNRCTILDSFSEFTKVEVLDKDEQWSCPRCKQKQPSTKKITITRLPRNLIIHLKRFDNMLNKNNIFVEYPHVLDLTSFWADDKRDDAPASLQELPTRGQVPPFKYKLYAVASHSGTLYGGHYTAYVNKGPWHGWCYYDDTSCRKVKNSDECITKSAYVLFYHRIYDS